MTTVIADITMSLDGFVTGRGADPQHGLGDAEEIHDWVMHGDEVDAEVLRSATAATGAVVMGRNLYDVVDGPDGWSAEMSYGAQEAGRPPFFVVTHSAPDGSRLASELGLDVTFVDGVAEAIEQARAAAGDRHVVIMGGGDVVAQAIELRLADELRLHLSPLLIGEGTPLFRPGVRQHYRQRDVVVSANAIHATYELVDEPSE